MSSRTLVLLRHGKAEPAGSVRSDFDRPLANRGVADAAAAGAWLAENGLLPNLVLCSPARRAAQTWRAVAGALSGEPPVAMRETLYTAGAPALLDLVAGVPDEIETLLVVGHNPILSIASMLLGAAGTSEDGLRTAGLAVHRSEQPWARWRAGGVPRVTAYTARAAAEP